MSRTVFVLGAGASKEVGLPIGSELTKEVASALSFEVQHGQFRRGGDPSILAVLQRAAAVEQNDQSRTSREHPLNAYLQASWRIRDAMPQSLSIDNFIDSHQDEQHVALCGKLAIVRTILKAEASSKLHVDRSNIYNKINFNNIRETWFARLFERLTEGCSKRAIKARFAAVTFVVFNYDRCLEHYLYCALQNYYQMSEAEAADTMRGLQILHPYGTVGQLSWKSPDQMNVNFGAEAPSAILSQLAQSIRTFTEGMNEEDGELEAIRSRVSSADRLVFLGFAFHRQNMRLLFAPGPEKRSAILAKVFGTTLSMSKGDVQSIADDLINYGLIPPFSLESVTCNALYVNYSRSLSFAN